ncbi:MAG: hypothetical protein AAB636_01855 [Patescibacteria group bacterium]
MENKTKQIKKIFPTRSTIIVLFVILVSVLYTLKFQDEKLNTSLYEVPQTLQIDLENEVELPVKWGDFGVKMIEVGVINKQKFEAIYSGRGGLSESGKKLLYESLNENLVINKENSHEILNMLWAFGLANKNPILENGPMMDPRYGGANGFASTGGWTLSDGDSMNHYNMHSFVTLTEEQQALVERVSKNIYRPCCDNSTYFPDCNHGMAMLGLLELMASQGVTEADMYKTALQVNTFWFPDSYETIEIYMKNKGVEWKDVNPQEILGINYSSASGYQNILSQMEPQEQQGGASCGA